CRLGPSTGRPLSGARTLPAARTLPRTRALPGAGPLSCAGSLAGAGPLSCTRSFSGARPLAAGPQHLVATAAAAIHAVLNSATIAAELLSPVRIVVSHAFAMFRIGLPVPAVQWIDPWPVSIDDVVAPIDTAAPIISARGPTAEGVAGAEREPGRDEAAGDISRPPEVIRRILRIGPCSVYDGGVVVRHIDRVGVGLLDVDDL